jgi:hypothetical protein
MARKPILPPLADLAALVAAEPTITRSDIARRFGVSLPAVTKACQKAGVVPVRGRGPSAKGTSAPRKYRSTSKQAARDAAAIVRMFNENPALTSQDVMRDLDLSSQSAHRAIARAGVRLTSASRKLPEDVTLARELVELGGVSVAAKYGVSHASVQKHAHRLGVFKPLRKQPHRKLPPDEVLEHEFDLFTMREIAIRHGCSYQSVIEARQRLGIQGRSARMPHATPPSGITSIIAASLAHLHEYRRHLRETDPDRARAVLVDIDALGDVAQSIRHIATIVAEPANVRSAS